MEGKINESKDPKVKKLLIEKHKCLELQLQQVSQTEQSTRLFNTVNQVANLPKMMLRDYNLYTKQALSPLGKNIVRLAKYLRAHNLNLKEVLSQPVYRVPHYHSHSKEFFINCRQGNRDRCEAMLRKFPILAHQIDFMGKTGVVWAVFRKDMKMLKLLLAFKADLDFCDFTGRSPLSYAITNEDEDMVKFLLDNRAMAWRDANLDYLEYPSSKWIKKLLTFYRRVWSLLCLFDFKEKTKKWQKILSVIKDKTPAFLMDVSDVVAFLYDIFN